MAEDRPRQRASQVPDGTVLRVEDLSVSSADRAILPQVSFSVGRGEVASEAPALTRMALGTA
jgi:ABC-type uncharacterized transport system ATPase subunit